MPLLSLPLRQARGLRFLALLLGLWLMVRLASYWPGEVPAALPLSPFAAPRELSKALDVPLVRPPLMPRREQEWGPEPMPISAPRQVLPLAPRDTPPQTASGFSSEQRHTWRLALLARLGARPLQNNPLAAFPMVENGIAPGIVPAAPLARWPDKAQGRWSLAATGYWRGGRGSTAPVGPGGTARLGGSQSAVRLGYLVDPQMSLRAYVRATHTPGRRDGGDVAVGVALRPVRSVPVDLYLERRTVVAGSEPDTTLVYAAGGFDNYRLPHDFRLSGYGQAGVAHYGDLVGFADAAVVVQRDVASVRGVRLALGSIAAVSVQPGARRLDAGPRASLLLTDVGQGARIALDWREQVAGNARPGSGLALTLAADF